jgi:hypothetical protein
MVATLQLAPQGAEEWVAAVRENAGPTELICSGGGYLELQVRTGKLIGTRNLFGIPDDEKTVEAYQSKKLCNMNRGIGDAEAVARLAGVAIERDESGEARGVNARDVAEIENDILRGDQRNELIEKLLLLPSDELSGIDNGGMNGWEVGVVHGNLLLHGPWFLSCLRLVSYTFNVPPVGRVNNLDLFIARGGPKLRGAATGGIC